MFLSKTECKLFLTFFLIYLFFVQWYGWNEQSHFSLTRAIVEEGKFEIDSFYNQTGDRAFFNNRYYSDKNPGLSFFASPIYSIWYFVYHNFFPENFIEKYSGDNKFISQSHDDVYIFTYVDPGFFIFTSMILVTVFTSSLFTSLTAILIYKITKYFTSNEKHRILVAIVYALGTLAFINALHFMSHALGTFFVFLSFFLLFKSKKEGSTKKLFILAGIAAGFSIVVEYSAILIVFLLLGYVFLVDKKESLIFLSALLLSISPLLLYNFLIFSNPFDLASSHIDRRIYTTAYPEVRLFFSSGNEYKEKIVLNSIFSIEDLLKHFHFIPNPNPYIILRLLIYPYRGLLFYSPVLFLSMIGMVFMFREYKAEVIFTLSILFLFLCFLSMRSNWWGGYCFGNRHLMPLIPFLTLPMIYVFKKSLKLVLPLVFLSIFINSLGLQPAEDTMYDWNAMRPKYSEELNSLKILSNPLLTHYLPSFLNNGPRSLIFEHLVNGYISIDIRVFPISKGANFPLSAFYVPFICLIPIFLISFVIWREEMINSMKKLVYR